MFQWDWLRYVQVESNIHNYKKRLKKSLKINFLKSNPSLIFATILIKILLLFSYKNKFFLLKTYINVKDNKRHFGPKNIIF